MSNLILFWHRRDLRGSDNLGLAAARSQSSKIVGVFCLDPHILQRDDIAPARVTYMIGCLEELQQTYLQAGSELLIIQETPVKGIPLLATTLNAQAVYWNLDVEPYARERDASVEEALQEQGIAVHTHWDQLLHSPGKIFTKATGKPYTVYTPFWKNWIKQLKAKPGEKLADLEGLTDEEKEKALSVGVINLPTAKDLGYSWDYPLPLSPGESAAKERLTEFGDIVWQPLLHHALTEYHEQRDFPAVDGTSRLSAALKFGAIGIRTVWQVVQSSYEVSRSDETRKNIQTWQQELAWREFFQHCLYFFPELAQGAYRPAFKNFPWENNEECFQAWCEGKTGYPIVDAAMRQLNETGWMHNRCRMIVANFLTKDLIINWQWGEKYFMQKLYDGDLAANNGGWQWSASSGMDQKPLRIFNPVSQAKRFDPEGEYIRMWLPELSSLETEYLVTGKIPADERDACGYPAPIVDHSQQQRKFKKIYKEVK